MANSIMTRDEVHAWCQEVADNINAELEKMTPEERQQALKDFENWGAQIGGFPVEEEDGN